MTTTQQTREKPVTVSDFAYTLDSGSPDVTVVCFGGGGPVRVLATDPALPLLQRGDKITFENRRTHTDYWPRSYTVYDITRIARYTDVYGEA